MGEENESFYDNLILESIRNNEEIPICRIENTPETPLIGSTPYLPSENIVNTSENMENVRPLSVENSRTKLENYIDEKYDQAAIKYLKEKILNEVKQQFSTRNHGDKINAELVERVFKAKYLFYTKRSRKKNTLLKMVYLQTVPV